MGVICEERSQTDLSFVLTSAQLSRPSEHNLANSVRNGDGLLSSSSLEEVFMFEG